MWSRFLALVLLLAPASAWAGACCGGSTSALPTRLGECETWFAGLGLGVDQSVGRWNDSGQVTSSSLSETSLTTSAAVSWRWDRKGQIGVIAPVLLNYRDLASERSWGGGLGDVQITATWNPINEKWAPPGKIGAPVPVFWAGLRLPTGRDWEKSKDPLMADVTGRGVTGLVAGFDFERTQNKIPYYVGANLVVGVDQEILESQLSLLAGVGRYFGPRWTLLGTVDSRFLWQGAPSRSTSLGARLIYGERLRWRAWTALRSDLPLPHLGRNRMIQVSGSLGIALVR